MLSGKLIYLIESHEEKLNARILREIRRDPSLTHLASLPEGELRERGREILLNLGHWLASANEEKIEREYEQIGRLRFLESVPLAEAIKGLCLMKYAMIDYVLEQGIDRDTLELYMEEELGRRMARFFDLLIIHMARGYEIEWRHALQVAEWQT
jgi:hypothetical protein